MAKALSGTVKGSGRLVKGPVDKSGSSDSKTEPDNSINRVQRVPSEDGRPETPVPEQDGEV